MNICIFCGARPNFIKVAPVVRVITDAIASGQHIGLQLVYAGAADDPTLEATLFDDLHIRRPDECLGVVCENLNELTGQVMGKFEAYLRQHPTDCVVVVDDLASTMAAAIVAKKQGVRLAHLAAGTRSFDINMPKEVNRLVIDGLSDILFTAGQSGSSIATKEGAEPSKVYMVGNVLMDNLRFLRTAWQRPAVADAFDGQPYVVLTINRRALIGQPELLRELLRVLAAKARQAGCHVVAMLRENARSVVEPIVGSEGFDKWHIVAPLSYLEFGWLEQHATAIVTDSGNVADEATFHQVPCITLNSYTEHVETVAVGTNVLVGEQPDVLSDTLDTLFAGRWKAASVPDRWDGRSAERIVKILTAEV